MCEINLRVPCASYQLRTSTKMSYVNDEERFRAAFGKLAGGRGETKTKDVVCSSILIEIEEVM